jgi:nucleoside-diphosphate-sugar epimerase
VWEWAEAHPDVDVTTSKSIAFLLSHIWLTKIGTVLPPFLYGPLPPQHLPLPKPEFDTISTNLVVYNLLFPNGVFMPASRYVDFRDVAQAHIGALDSKLDKKNRKRIVFVSPHGLTVKDVLDIIKKDRPDLERRFITAPAPQFPYDKLDVDFDS